MIFFPVTDGGTDRHVTGIGCFIALNIVVAGAPSAQIDVFVFGKLNAERLFETEDQTFAKAGTTGLWPKADSVTYFDEFSVTGK